jgi:hypothetical protein
VQSAQLPCPKRHLGQCVRRVTNTDVSGPSRQHKGRSRPGEIAVEMHVGAAPRGQHAETFTRVQTAVLSGETPQVLPLGQHER